MTRRAALLCPLLLPGCGGGRRVDAGGATSLDPLIQTWAAAYRRLTGTEIDYVKRGSGYGVAQVAAGTLRLGVTDDRPTPAEVARAAGRLVTVPLAVGSVAVVYHLPGLAGPLVLSGAVLADILAVRVTRWDAPAVAALNPGVRLPSLPVRPVVRSEASGTTATLAAHLCRVNPAFAAEVGAGRKPHWPAGLTAEEGSDGVTGAVERTPGAVGYVEGRFARRTGLATAALDDPLAMVGYAVLPGRPDPAAVGFVRWAVGDGQRLVGPAGYGPLTAELNAEAKNALAGEGGG